jgi:phosphopantothenoylcysteine synthetase/decarboxylase
VKPRLLVTAGPTREPVDPVRYLSNRSSGRMGYALAAAARDAGWEVTLVSGPVHLTPPSGIRLVSVETARQMYDAVHHAISAHSVAIFAAAVSDFRPIVPSVEKIKKGQSDRFTIECERTEDILGSARSVFGFRGYLVGFAAETQNLVEHAQEKLRSKQCDLIVGNDVSRPGVGFDSLENEIILCLPGGETFPLPRDSKTALAGIIIRFIGDHATLRPDPEFPPPPPTTEPQS